HCLRLMAEAPPAKNRREKDDGRRGGSAPPPWKLPLRRLIRRLKPAKDACEGHPCRTAGLRMAPPAHANLAAHVAKSGSAGGWAVELAPNCRGAPVVWREGGVGMSERFGKVRPTIAYEEDVHVWVYLDQVDRVVRYEAYLI